MLETVRVVGFCVCFSGRVYRICRWVECQVCGKKGIDDDIEVSCLNVQKNTVAINLFWRDNLRDDLFAHGNFKVKTLIQ